jgi:hypothetical protein
MPNIADSKKMALPVTAIWLDLASPMAIGSEEADQLL